MENQTNIEVKKLLEVLRETTERLISNIQAKKYALVYLEQVLPPQESRQLKQIRVNRNANEGHGVGASPEYPPQWITFLTNLIWEIRNNQEQVRRRLNEKVKEYYERNNQLPKNSSATKANNTTSTGCSAGYKIAWDLVNKHNVHCSSDGRMIQLKKIMEREVSTWAPGTKCSVAATYQCAPTDEGIAEALIAELSEEEQEKLLSKIQISPSSQTSININQKKGSSLLKKCKRTKAQKNNSSSKLIRCQKAMILALESAVDDALEDAEDESFFERQRIKNRLKEKQKRYTQKIQNATTMRELEDINNHLEDDDDIGDCFDFDVDD